MPGIFNSFRNFFESEKQKNYKEYEKLRGLKSSILADLEANPNSNKLYQRNDLKDNYNLIMYLNKAQDESLGRAEVLNEASAAIEKLESKYPDFKGEYNSKLIEKDSNKEGIKNK